MTRSKACKIIARTRNMDELVGFFKHPNRHVRHAARFKAYRLAPEDQRVADVISNIEEDIKGYKAALEAAETEHKEVLAAWSAIQGEKPPAPGPKEVPALDPSYWWTYNAAQRYLVAL